MLLTHKDILFQLYKIEKKLTAHDEDIRLIFEYEVGVELTQDSNTFLPAPPYF